MTAAGTPTGVTGTHRTRKGEIEMNVLLINPRAAIRVTALMVVSAAATILFAGPAIFAHAEASQLVDATISDELLRIKGTHDDDQLTIRLKAGDANVLEVDVGDDGTADFSFDRASFAEITVSARGGDDVVRVDEANGAIIEPTSIRGGNGDDTLLGGSAVETFVGGNGDDFIDGNRGADVAFMGRGDDTFRWDPGDASDVVEGDAGSDAMVFNGANGGETVDVSADGGRIRFFRNPGPITMDLNDVEVAVFNALGGSDTITVNDLTGTDATDVDVNLDSGLGTGVGDGLPDSVTVTGTAGDDSIVVAGETGDVAVTGLSATVAIGSAEFANDQLNVETAAGVDTVDSTGLAAGVIQLAVN
jgi:Ca2+-binding RTX toxin-like protein